MKAMRGGAALAAGLAWAGMLLAAGARPAAAARAPQGRVSAVEGNLLVRGADDEDWSYLERNAVVYDDDIVWADEDSLAEIEMEQGAWLRLGPDTRVDIRRLPPAGELSLKRGSVYVDLSDEVEEGVIVRTPGGEVGVEPGSLARVDLGRGDSVRVLVRRGRVTGEVAHGMGRRAAAGDLLMLRPDEQSVRLVALDRREFDAFDDWADDRVAYYLDRQLPPGVDRYLPGVCELADYGDWVEADGGKCWRPRRVADDWRPYSVGYWGYSRGEPLWIAAEPWGYTTCHYGRWFYSDRYGWLWRPAYVWGPGWVRWASCGDQVLWVPLDPYDRPCYRYPPRNVGGMMVDSRTWCCMPRDNFYRRDRTRIIVVERAPLIRITEIRPVREVTVIYRDLPPTYRYRCVRTTTRTTVVATDRLAVLERRPPRPEYRVAAIRSIPAGDRSGFDGQRPAAPREEVRARVSRQVTVPAVRVNRVAGTADPGGAAPRGAAVDSPGSGDRFGRDREDGRGPVRPGLPGREPAARPGDRDPDSGRGADSGSNPDRRSDDGRSPIDRTIRRVDDLTDRDERDRDGRLVPNAVRRTVGDGRDGEGDDRRGPGREYDRSTDGPTPRGDRPTGSSPSRGPVSPGVTGREPARESDPPAARPGVDAPRNPAPATSRPTGPPSSSPAARSGSERDNGRGDRGRGDRSRRDRSRDRDRENDDAPAPGQSGRG